MLGIIPFVAYGVCIVHRLQALWDAGKDLLKQLSNKGLLTLMRIGGRGGCCVGSGDSLVQISVIPLSTCVTCDMLFNLSVPLFPYGGNNSTHFIRWL